MIVVFSIDIPFTHAREQLRGLIFRHQIDPLLRRKRIRVYSRCTNATRGRFGKINILPIYLFGSLDPLVLCPVCFGLGNKSRGRVFRCLSEHKNAGTACDVADRNDRLSEGRQAVYQQTRGKDKC